MCKVCGHYPGYCLFDGACDLGALLENEERDWVALEKAARSCPHRVVKNRAGRITIAQVRRRRDWKVGNPYERR